MKTSKIMEDVDRAGRKLTKDVNRAGRNLIKLNSRETLQKIYCNIWVERYC
uniref:Uncharacterized protein n=1 Tax=Onchocerca volvulus TaxID=6282 RepID=A0A8R1XMS4_ONCVO